MMSEVRPLLRIVGDVSYFHDSNWEPRGLTTPLGWVSGVAADRDGCVWIYQRTMPTLVVLTVDDGSHVRSIDLGTVEDPHEIVFDASGSPLLVDRDGQRIHRLEDDDDASLTPLFGDFRFAFPTSVAVSPTTGDYFVADGYGGSSVHRFGADGNHLTSWGRPGIGPGEFNIVHAIAVDREGRVVVLDRENGRVQRFTEDGEPIDVWSGFHRPLGLHLDCRADLVFISEASTRLTVRTNEGEIVGVGRAPDLSHGLGGDDAGSLYLAMPAIRAVVKLFPSAIR